MKTTFILVATFFFAWKKASFVFFLQRKGVGSNVMIFVDFVSGK